jgi:diguanylate cyclase (GGDEF)-like protein/PAS domain S-box-containing protein
MPQLPHHLGSITSAGELALSVFDAIDSASVCVFDTDLRYVMAVGGALARHGWSAADMEGRLVPEVLGADVYTALGPNYEGALQGRTSRLDWTSRDGTAEYALTFLPLRDDEDAVIGGFVVLRETTEARRAERALAGAEKRIAAAFENAPIGMALIGMDWRILKVNRALCQVTGYPDAEMTGSDCRAAVHPDDVPLDRKQVARLLRGDIESYEVEKRYVTAGGELIWLWHAVTFVAAEPGEPAHLIVQVVDVSERRRLQERLHRLADHDDLTGLWNRRRFEEELVRQVARCRRYGERAALLMLDLDGFKEVNDTFGHKAGDDVLRNVSDALRGQVRTADTVARLGGDEFAVLLANVGPDQAAALAEELGATIRAREVDLGGTTVRLTASVGIAFLDETVQSDQIALINADVAMYAAKAAGRDRTSVRPAAPRPARLGRRRLSVVHCEDSEAYRRLVATMLAADHAIDIVAGVSTCDETIARSEQLAPDVILLDASVPGCDVVIPALRDAAPASRIVLLSGLERGRLEQLRDADGAVGKSAPFEELASVIRAVAGRTADVA